MQKSINFGQISLSYQVQGDKKDRLTVVISMMVSVMKWLLLLLKHILSIIKGPYALIQFDQKRILLTFYDILCGLVLQRSFSFIEFCKAYQVSNKNRQEKMIASSQGGEEAVHNKKIPIFSGRIISWILFFVIVSYNFSVRAIVLIWSFAMW